MNPHPQILIVEDEPIVAAADPQKGSMYCLGRPNARHTVSATVRLPPK